MYKGLSHRQHDLFQYLLHFLLIILLGRDELHFKLESEGSVATCLSLVETREGNAGNTVCASPQVHLMKGICHSLHSRTENETRELRETRGMLCHEPVSTEREPKLSWLTWGFRTESNSTKRNTRTVWSLLLSRPETYCRKHGRRLCSHTVCIIVHYPLIWVPVPRTPSFPSF